MICCCLYVTEVDPERMNVPFERFISVDARSRRTSTSTSAPAARRGHAVHLPEVRTRPRGTDRVDRLLRKSAIRDVGKALGLELEVVDRPEDGLRLPSNGSATPACSRTSSTPPTEREAVAASGE
jgi:error-prone DNA polymerase